MKNSGIYDKFKLGILILIIILVAYQGSPRF